MELNKLCYIKSTPLLATNRVTSVQNGWFLGCGVPVHQTDPHRPFGPVSSTLISSAYSVFLASTQTLQYCQVSSHTNADRAQRPF